MESFEWVILDTETTGIKRPIYVVEIAAQKMIGFKRNGKPFRKLVNHNTEIPSEASRVHGYTKEILNRDGELANKVYDDLREYVRNLPISAYNLSYDWDEVLIPEWERLGISPIGKKGFCSYRLAQRLLDPSPAGNLKLQTLRQYYRLPERGAHTALGDVDTVIDLFGKVLSKKIKEKGINSFEEIFLFAEKDWFPSIIPFGQYKGVDYREAKKNTELKKWLEWLSKSDNERSAKFGLWYLSQLNSKLNFTTQHKTPEAKSEGLTNKKELEISVENLRSDLSEINSKIIAEQIEVKAVQSKLFQLTKEHYQKRDRLVLLIKYRRQFLDILLTEGEEEAQSVLEDFNQEDISNNKEYEEASSNKNTKTLSKEEQKELKKVWKNLARVYHPDVIVSEPEKQETYQNLSSAINLAKEQQDIDLLREISDDTNLYVMKQGWLPIDITNDQTKNLEKLIVSLTQEITSKENELRTLKASSEYEIMLFCRDDLQRLKEIANKQITSLEKQIIDLELEADSLGKEIVELTNTSIKII